MGPHRVPIVFLKKSKGIDLLAELCRQRGVGGLERDLAAKNAKTAKKYGKISLLSI